MRSSAVYMYRTAGRILLQPILQGCRSRRRGDCLRLWSSSVREVEVVSPYGSAGKDFCEKMPGPFGWVFLQKKVGWLLRAKSSLVKPNNGA
jgi:hypothetical protein